MEQATQVYDLFEAVVEAELETLESILISIEIDEFVEVNVCFQSGERGPQTGKFGSQTGALKNKFPATEWSQDEDGLQYITWRVRKADVAYDAASENLTAGGSAYGQS